MRGDRWIVGWTLMASACATAGEPEATPPPPEAGPVAVQSEDGSPRERARPQADDPAPSRGAEEREAPSSPAPNALAHPARANEEPPPLDERWLPSLRAAVDLYPGWGRIDDEARWAPWLCRMPRPPSARFSESGDDQTHGDKLYTLYAMDPVAYGAPGSAMSADARPIDGIAQVIVKESFTPVTREQAEAQGLEDEGLAGPHGLMPASRDGETYVAGPRRGLYVMMKVDGDTRGTDAGWVYATLLPDDRTVTAVGIIDSCAGCHREAGPDRLFGLPGREPPPPSGRTNRANAKPL